MEFWGVEVPSGKPVACDPDDISYIHISQAALGERTSGEGKGERVVLKLTVDGSEFVIATLSAGKCEQTTFDLILDREFLISHNGSSSVYLTGYKTDAVRDEDFSDEDGFSDSEEEEEEEDEDDEDEDEDIPTPIQISANKNGKLARKVKEKGGDGDKTTTASAKGKPFDININGKADEDEDGEDEDEDEDDDSDVDLDMLDSRSGSDLDSDDSDNEDSSEEEDQAKDQKKRPFRGAQNASAGKKIKVATTQEDGKPGKKGAKAPITTTTTTTTPKQQHLQNGKKDKKTSAKENDAQPAIPNSGKKAGRFVCSPCNKNFNNESSLSQHMNAKHK